MQAIYALAQQRHLTLNLESFRKLMMLILNSYINKIRCDARGDLQNKYKAKRIAQSFAHFWKSDNILPEQTLSMILKPDQRLHLCYFSKGQAEELSAHCYFSAWNLLEEMKIDTLQLDLSNITNQLKDGSELKKILLTCEFHVIHFLELIKKECQLFLSQEKNKEYLTFIQLQNDLKDISRDLSILHGRAVYEKEKEQSKTLNYITHNLDQILQEMTIDPQFKNHLLELKKRTQELSKITNKRDEFAKKKRACESLKKQWPFIETETQYLKEALGSIEKIQSSAPIDSQDIAQLFVFEKYPELIEHLNNTLDIYCNHWIQRLSENSQNSSVNIIQLH